MTTTNSIIKLTTGIFTIGLFAVAIALPIFTSSLNTQAGSLQAFDTVKVTTTKLNVRDNNCKATKQLTKNTNIILDGKTDSTNPIYKICKIGNVEHNMVKISLGIIDDGSDKYVAINFVTFVGRDEFKTENVVTTANVNLRDNNCKKITQLKKNTKILLPSAGRSIISCNIGGQDYAMISVTTSDLKEGFIAMDYLK
jgi:hypothetical protein